jgi:hypothetical protein
MKVTVTRDKNGHIIKNADLVDEAKRHFDYLFNYGGSTESVDFFLELLRQETVNTELIFHFIVQQLEFDIKRSQEANAELRKIVGDNTDKQQQPFFLLRNERDYAELELLINNILGKHAVLKDPGRRKFLIYNLIHLTHQCKLEQKSAAAINFPVFIQNTSLPKISAEDKAKKLEVAINKIKDLLEFFPVIKPFFAVLDFNYDSTPVEQRKGWRCGHWRTADRLFGFVEFILNELKTKIEEIINTTETNGRGQQQNNLARVLCIHIKDLLKQFGVNDNRDLLKELFVQISDTADMEIETPRHIVDWVCNNQ